LINRLIQKRAISTKQTTTKSRLSAGKVLKIAFISSWFLCFVFLVLDEEDAALAHHLPTGFVSNCILASAFAAGCRLVEVDFASSPRTSFDQPIYDGRYVSAKHKR
jgi:hypothetical protein